MEWKEILFEVLVSKSDNSVFNCVHVIFQLLQSDAKHSCVAAPNELRGKPVSTNALRHCNLTKNLTKKGKEKM